MSTPSRQADIHKSSRDKLTRHAPVLLLSIFHVLVQYERQRPLTADDAASSDGSGADEAGQLSESQRSDTVLLPGPIRFLAYAHHILGSMQLCCSHDGEIVLLLEAQLRDLPEQVTARSHPHTG